MGMVDVGGDVGEATSDVGIGEPTTEVGVGPSSSSPHAVTEATPRKSNTMTSILKA
jgi:hypothetical protein